jgi:hypothetical protein
MKKAQKMRAVTLRDPQHALQRAQRKYLRGPIVEAEVRGGAKQQLDQLPEAAFVGERVRSFIAVSSWFWYCYPCSQSEDRGGPDASLKQ